MEALFTPAKIGRYTTRNRIFMAPMSRYRSDEKGCNPDMTIDYYRQRASAGLIIAESTRINDWAGGINCPGIYNHEQMLSWKKAVDAVHEEGGLIFLQLWHSGRAAHKSLLPEGRDVVAPSAIASQQETMTYNGLEMPTPPREITLDEIAELRRDFANASELALQAGFDGIEIHAAGGFIIDSFLQTCTNKRDDQYGGSLENRYRFLKEIMDDSVAIWGADRVGIKLSPTSKYNDVGTEGIEETFSYVVKELNKYGLAFLEINEAMPFAESTQEEINTLNNILLFWHGPYIANGNYSADSAAEKIATQQATAVSFGRLFIANPDLPERFKTQAEFNELDMERFYGGNEQGYTDYPSLS